MLKIRKTLALLMTMCLLAPGFARAEDALPSSKELMDKMLVASGGRETLGNIKSLLVKTTMTSPMGLNGTATACQMEDGRISNVVELGGMGTIQQVYDGTVGWESNPMTGISLMTDDQVALLKRSGLKSSLNPEENYKSFDVTAVEEVDGKSAYVVKAVTKEGMEVTSYVAKETSLPVQMKMTMKNPQMGEIPMVTKLTEYKDFNGLKVPTVIIQEVMGQTITMTVTDVQQNGEVPANTFTQPDDVKKLIAKKSASPATQPSAPAAGGKQMK